MENRIIIQTTTQDPVASAMLEQLATQVERQITGAKDVSLNRISPPGEKCGLANVLTFFSGVAASVVASALWDLMKRVFSNMDHPKEYNWCLIVQIDRPTRVIVQSGKEGPKVIVEDL